MIAYFNIVLQAGALALALISLSEATDAVPRVVAVCGEVAGMVLVLFPSVVALSLMPRFQTPEVDRPVVVFEREERRER